MGTICLILWAFITSYVFFKTVKSIGKLRICKLYEVAGIDILMHTVSDVLGKQDDFDRDSRSQDY